MNDVSKNYVVYHLHSDLSNGVTNIDSVTKYKEYVEADEKNNSISEKDEKNSGLTRAGRRSTMGAE